MNKFFKSFYAILTGLLVLTLAACDKPDEKIQERANDSSIIEEQPPLETTAKEIAKEYADNVVAADLKFKDTTFYVTGKIVAVSKNFIKEPHVSLEGGINPDKEPQFAFAITDREKASELKIGQEVRLQCVGQGDLAEAPMAGDCRLLE